MTSEEMAEAGLTPEDMEEIRLHMVEVSERAAEQNIKCCFDSDDPNEICDFDFVSCCRTCNKPDVERTTITVGNPALLASWQSIDAMDTMVSYSCRTCESLTMVSDAMYCPKCGVCLFHFTMDEEIFGVVVDKE